MLLDVSIPWISTRGFLPSGRSDLHDVHDAHEDAEKGLHDASQSVPAIPPLAYFEAEPTTSNNVTGRPLQAPPAEPGNSLRLPTLKVMKLIPAPRQSANGAMSRWILFHLWFNTYRKFFLLCTSLNLAAMILAGLGHFPYAMNHSGAMVLGNLLFAVLGDFTKKLVSDPPKMVWTRELKFAGVGHTSAMYRRGLRVCTGTGIGAALSTCIQSPNCFLIWIGSDQDKTFGTTISDLVHRNIEPDRMILWDTKKRGGRPDTMKLLRETWDSFKPEVVFITSNKQGNDEIMEGCYKSGIPAFGTLWDF
ncbi:hypothetical protein FSARC_8496 [Fusarium sarcochroum]|uniref:Uncharacterized protein n=1 Tax=Fusarium sarcochroum TaxID=1208366 RepID=A0A8H4TSZ3_9HYPO|nr:hypothetical protein FSARC_8496 [Fusarium sarcochroum]